MKQYVLLNTAFGLKLTSVPQLFLYVRTYDVSLSRHTIQSLLSVHSRLRSNMPLVVVNWIPVGVVLAASRPRSLPMCDMNRLFVSALKEPMIFYKCFGHFKCVLYAVMTRFEICDSRLHAIIQEQNRRVRSCVHRL
jgi:hypothetical protein